MPYHLRRPSGSPPAVYPGFHDGYLTSISVGEKSATLGLRSFDGECYSLVLRGVEALRANEFREGNIIFEIEVVQGEPAFTADVPACLSELFPSPHPSAAESYHRAHASRLAEIARRVTNGDAALVSLTASYGCDLIALCSDIALIPEA